MLTALKNILLVAKYNKKGGTGAVIAGIIIALIIAAAIIIAMSMYTSSQTHPFWEVK